METAAQVKGFLGLCARAGQLVYGQDACVDAIRKHSVALTLLDEDSSPNTRKRLLDTCAAHGTPIYQVEAELIARAVGKEGRKVVAVKKGNMADKMRTLFKDEPILCNDPRLVQKD